MQTLCQPYDPFREQPVFYNEIFLPGRVNISLRPFHTTQDLVLVNKWLNFQFPQSSDSRRRDPFQYNEDYYTTLITDAHSQPLLGIIDRNPAFQVDIYQAFLGPDYLVDGNHFSDNDFIMQLILSPQAMKSLPLHIYTLVSCLDCFFRYAEINSVIWMSNAREKNSHFIAGLAELEEITCGEENTSSFVITKKRFKEVQSGLWVYPEKRKAAINF